ncbi:MAG TPA: MMPL family transporter [Solirubrobacteraceae bacterium]|nr:MMPL family transporter [Solirubrobacteraceae bacterium]
MLKLARWSTTHRVAVLVGWVIVLIAVGALGRAAGTDYSSNFTIPNSDAQRAYNLLASQFPQQAGDRDEIVFRVDSGTVTDPAVRDHMQAMFDQVAKLPHVTSVVSPYEAPGAISRDGKIAFATVVFDKRANEIPVGAIDEVMSTAKAAARAGLEVELGGQAIESAQKPAFGVSTAVGLMAAIVVLLITFGSLTAMGLPILTALFGLGTGLSAIALFTHVSATPNFASELAAMIGLGVGIDYALFILTRFREAYRTPGPTEGDVRESTIKAMDTAGRAVLFAGCTVVIALLGMIVLGISFLYGLAISASIGVLLMMLASLTLMPALLMFTGHRVARSGRRGASQPGTGGLIGAGRRWINWSAFIARRPALIAVLSGLLMLAFAVPALSMRLGSSDAANDPTTQTTYKAYQLLEEGFGPGFNGPLTIAVKLPDPASAHATLAAVEAAITKTGDVLAVSPPRVSPSGKVGTLTVIPASSPQAQQTNELVEHLRSTVLPPVEHATGANVYVGGFTAGAIDFANTLSEKLPLFIGVVVLLSALLLLIVFRSVVIPIQAAIMNLLSISASLGVIVAIFQKGWLGGALNLKPGPIESFVPVMLFAIVFGLSMDYEVFLISRVHERWLATRDASRSVAEGLALTGRVITAAATIMVCVFLSFVLGEERVIREFGLSLAVAVALDALVVRCLLLPATLHLIGRAAWWMPESLRRILPRVHVEGKTSVPQAPATPEPALSSTSS